MPKNSTLKQILANTGSGWLAVIIRAAIALVMVPFLLDHLGKEGYGLIGLLGVIVSLSSVADLGLRGALGRELAEQVVRNDRQAFSELASTALLLYSGMALILVLAGWSLAPWFVHVFKIPGTLQASAIWIIRLYGSVSIILSFITPVFTAALSSYHRFDIVNAVQIIGGIVSSLMLFVILPVVGNALYGWAGVMLGYSLVMLVLTVFFFFRFCEGAQIGIRYLNPARLHPLFKLGGYMYALQMTNALAERSDPLVISYFFGPAGVALYQPGGRLSQMIRPVVTMLADQMYPLTTKQHVDNQYEKMQKILILGTKYTLLLGSLFSAGMLVFAEPFCRLWLSKSIGDDYQIAARVMMGWALADMMTYAAGTQWSVLLGIKTLKVLIWTQIPTAVLNILVSIYLVGFTRLGIPGVLAATVLIGFIRRPVLIWYTAKVCRLAPATYFRTAYIRPLCCFLITFSGACLIRLFVDCNSYGFLAVSAGFAGLVWGTSSWAVGLTAPERQIVMKAFQNKCQKGTD